MYKNVLIALDGSEQSIKALDHAVAIAEKFGSELTILTVVPKIMFPFFSDEDLGTLSKIDIKSILQIQEGLKAFHQDVLTNAEAKIRTENPDLSISTVLMEGRPSAIIVDLAEKGGYDLIVMRSRGKKDIIEWFLGSTSNSVVDSCTMPVLVVK